MLNGAEKKIEELNDCHKGEIKNLYDELEKTRANAKAAGYTHTKELTKLKMEKKTLQQGKDIELSDAFSLSFAAYLKKIPLLIQIMTGHHIFLQVLLLIWSNSRRIILQLS